jgi:hypothetical protein
MNLLLVDMDAAALERTRNEIAAQYPGDFQTLVVDLRLPNAAEIIAQTAAPFEVGLMVFNATWQDLGPFLSRPLADHLAVVDVNCRTPVALAHLFGNRMINRKKGGMIFMASLTAFQGTPFIATYGASKSFNLSLGEALGAELASAGIDVLVAAPGVITTPNYLNSLLPGIKNPAPVMSPETAARQTLDRLGHQRVFIPGIRNRLIAFLMSRLLPRRLAAAVMGRATKNLYGSR